jgi:type II secretory pathway component PulF
MKTVATVNLVIFAIVCAIAMYLGIAPKKWQTWLLSLYSFLSFFFVGIVGTGNFYESVAVGAIVTFALIFGGIITYWNRERAEKWLKEHGEDEE